MIYLHNEILFSHKEKWDCGISRKMDRNKNNNKQQNKPDSGRQIEYVNPSFKITLIYKILG